MNLKNERQRLLDYIDNKQDVMWSSSKSFAIRAYNGKTLKVINRLAKMELQILEELKAKGDYKGIKERIDDWNDSIISYQFEWWIGQPK